MSLTPKEQRKLADECDLEFKGWDELAAYTFAVEARVEERHTCHPGSCRDEMIWREELKKRDDKISLLQVENALYASDAKRCWELMPELANTDADYELHEAVQIITAKLVATKTKLAFSEIECAQRGEDIRERDEEIAELTRKSK